MFFVDVCYKCGHNSKQGVSRASKIKTFIDFAKNNICEICAMDAGENFLNAKRAELLPILEGSDKQVCWADSLRNKFLDELKEYLYLCFFQRESFSKKTKMVLQAVRSFDLAKEIAGRVYDFFAKNKRAQMFIIIKDKVEKAVSGRIFFETFSFFPKEQKFEECININETDSQIQIAFTYNAEIISIAKNLSFTWESGKDYWYCKKKKGDSAYDFIDYFLRKGIICCLNFESLDSFLKDVKKFAKSSEFLADRGARLLAKEPLL